jgi:hypothetical protein
MYKVFELEIIYEEEYISPTKMSAKIYVISIGKSYIEYLPTKAKLSGNIKLEVYQSIEKNY